MQSNLKKRVQHISLAGLIVLVVVFFAVDRLNQDDQLPAGVVLANGRIEAEQIDIASKITGRLKAVYAFEGDLVNKNQVLVVLDTIELEANLAGAKAELARAEESVQEGKAQVQQSKNRLGLANKQLARVAPLVESGGVSRQLFDQRESEVQNAIALEAAAVAHLHTLEQSALAAKSKIDLFQSKIDDCTLRSPTRGRVLYQLAENAEVVAAGVPILTVLDLSKVYMEVYLPASNAARLAIGSQARLKLDILPEHTVPATVVFVSPEAQFTPKQVETRSDRENLMFRVKLRVPQELVERYITRVKTGVRGDAYVQVDEADPWPEWLAVNLPEPDQTASNTEQLQE